MFLINRNLERAIARFRRPDSPREDGVAGRISAAAFRAGMEQRMRTAERDLGELKTRLNGLIFLAVGTVLTQVLLKVVQ